MFLAAAPMAALAFPAGDSPYLSVKVSGPTLGSHGTSVSKQKVELENNGDVKYEPHHPHVPPFTAFKKDYKPVYVQPKPAARQGRAEPF